MEKRNQISISKSNHYLCQSMVQRGRAHQKCHIATNRSGCNSLHSHNLGPEVMLPLENCLIALLDILVENAKNFIFQTKTNLC